MNGSGVVIWCWTLRWPGASQPVQAIGHEAQGEILRDEPFHQSLCTGEVQLASPGSTIRLRLGKMKRGGDARRLVQPYPRMGRAPPVAIALEQSPLLKPFLAARPRQGRREVERC